MGLSAGIVGLPNVGKSTIFNALCAGGAESANYPFCTIEPNVGIVPVPDRRLEKIAALAKSREVVFTDLRIVDIAGLVKGASKGEGLGNQFLANIRETDAVIHVVRCFDDPNVVHVEGSVDPARDIDIIETELLLADLDSVNKRMERAGKMARVGQKDAKRTVEILERAVAAIDQGTPLRAVDWSDEDDEAIDDDDQLDEQPDDPNAAKRFWFEHATGSGKSVAALGFVEATRTGGVLILTHRRNLVEQFEGELRDRGYADRISPALTEGQDPVARGKAGPVTVETYQWFVRNAGSVSSAYTIIICDEAHTALGEKTSQAIREWTGPIFIGMTATGALIARHVTDLFPTQTSRFDLAQAARRGVIAPLRCVRIPPGPGVRTIAKVPLRRGEVDTEFDQEMLAELLDQAPFNMAVADLYKVRFNGVPGVVYAAGVR
ncbi:MAG: 50S ribosome-binding GTPase, partial [Acidobacteria bacterium]|nr:50S ribosome-binding GTPase [Acidobacteriota bacterium]